MDREKDRERAVARSDVASLWIDFVLLPDKLEEHLAAGTAAIPTPPDLISMFLEQALVNHKAANGSASANNILKDAEPQGSSKIASRTAFILCERAARVAVVAQFTLSDIELSIPSQKHQFLLLKALIKHDKSRSLIHQCNLHRWLIHKALQCHPVGSAAPNAAFPVNRLGCWAVGDDLGDCLKSAVTANGDFSAFNSTGDNRIEEERGSLEFLEKVLQDEESFTSFEEHHGINHVDASMNKITSNGGSARDHPLAADYKCQVMLDIAEVHFMRGRIRSAQEFFSMCDDLLNCLPSSLVELNGESHETPLVSTLTTRVRSSGTRVSPVPRDRLAGFILACRMLLGSKVVVGKEDSKKPIKGIAIQESQEFVGVQLPVQSAVTPFEQSRVLMKAACSEVVVGNSASVVSAVRKIPQSEDKADLPLRSRTFIDMVDRAMPEDSPDYYSNKRRKLSVDVDMSKQGMDTVQASELHEEDILVHLLQVDNLSDIETLVLQAGRLLAGSAVVVSISDTGQSRGVHNGGFGVQKKYAASVCTCGHNQSQKEPKGPWSTLSDYIKGKPPGEACAGCQSSISTHGMGSSLGTFAYDVVTVLRRRAFNALDVTKDFQTAKKLYELALSLRDDDFDSTMMLWFLERCCGPERQGLEHYKRALPGKVRSDFLPSFWLLEVVILQLIEKEVWGALAELCQWGVQLMRELLIGEGELIAKPDSKSGTGAARVPEASSEGTQVKKHTAGWQCRRKRLVQTLKVATALGDLMPLCVKLQAAASRNHFNEDVGRLGSTMWQLFEDFMCLLVGMEAEGQPQGGDGAQSRTTQMGMGPLPPYPGAAGVPIICKLSNPRVLMGLASLTAGWLHRCHAAGLTPWPLAVERYGVLAGVTYGASLPPPVGSLPHGASVYRPVPPKVPPEFGRDLFGVLLERIVGFPGVVEGDKEKGHRWLQGLADLAFEGEAYVKAVQLYLQAGAIRSAHYCDRASSMPRDIFTPWVIGRMVASCRTIGAGLQAVILCQCLPVPDHESAFRILQENTLIVDRDAAAYFECIWEIPILELLVHMHAKSGDEARVSALIGLLQQPALNVHNPPAIRQAHICAMEQRFLQRLSGELL